MKQKKKKNPSKKGELTAAYLFTIPSFVGFLVFVFIPIIWVVIISFQKYNVFTTASTFVGWENYKQILTNSRSLIALKNTLWYTVLCALGNTGMGLVLAVLVDDVLPHKLSVFFRSIYFFPSLIGLTFVAIIWQAFFQTDAGVINYYLSHIGIANYEAAEIDGANAFQRFRRVIVPLASPQIFFVLIMNVTGALRIYESISVLTNGGPGDSSRSLVMLIAEKGFTSFDYGQASALSILLLILISIVTLIQFVGSRKWVHYE